MSKQELVDKIDERLRSVLKSGQRMFLNTLLGCLLFGFLFGFISLIGGGAYFGIFFRFKLHGLIDIVTAIVLTIICWKSISMLSFFVFEGYEGITNDVFEWILMMPGLAYLPIHLASGIVEFVILPIFSRPIFSGIQFLLEPGINQVALIWKILFLFFTILVFYTGIGLILGIILGSIGSLYRLCTGKCKTK